jgi:hypothetical protein
MAARRVDKEPAKPRRSAKTPEARENQLIAAAVDLAEQQMLAGTASSQVITHYLKLGSSREKLEQERLQKENSLLDAKKEALEAAGRIEELFTAAVDAFRGYSGQPVPELEELDD